MPELLRRQANLRKLERISSYWLPAVILTSWEIAFFEYSLAVPANRWGSAVYTAAQLKPIQEVIALGSYFIFHEWS